MKKVFFLDVDGTIVDGNRGMRQVSEKTKYAVKQLSKENYVFIASGRCKGLLEKQILDLNPNGYILCNGAYSEINNQMIYSEYFNQEAVESIISFINENNGFYVFETLNHMFVNELKAPEFIKFLSGWGKDLKDFQTREVLGGKYHIAMAGFVDEETCQKCERELSKYVDLGRHHTNKSYDLNIKGIDKGIGVKKVMEYLNIDADNAYCFGDGVNDLEMLKTVGHPVIMKNCMDEIKNFGFEETDDVLDDGVYKYLVRNNLIKPL